MRVVVTGGAGFIGAHTCRALVAGGHDVTVFDDLSTGSPANLAGTGARLVEGTILDADAVARVVEDADAVVHLAARSSVPRSFDEPGLTCRVNIEGTAIVAGASAGRHLVVASSSSVYGGNDVLPKHEELLPLPLNPYAASKLEAERVAAGSSSLVLRFFNVFGPGQPPRPRYAAVVPAFVESALQDRPLPVHGDGRQTRDFTYVTNVATVLAESVDRRVVHGGAVNLAFGTRVSLLELADDIGALLRKQLRLDFVPSRCGDMRDTQADTTRFRTLFPDVEPVELKDGLRATIEWFRRQS